MEESRTVRVAAAQYPIEPVGTWDRFAAKTERWVAEACSAGARLLLFPEYTALELASCLPEAVRRDPIAQIEALQAFLPDYRDHFRRLADAHGAYVLAGTFPVRREEGSYRNRAFFFGPGGLHDYQDKLTMTRFENEAWPIGSGRAIKLFDTAVGRVAVDICYDSEFPAYARMQVEKGACILLVPSSTATMAGYHRVRIGCQARALENQCFVVHAPTVGDAGWSAAVGRTHGAAAVYGPVDESVDDDGIYAIGRMDEPGWVYADIHPPDVERVRSDGEVFNYRDWAHQRDFEEHVVVTARL